MSVGEGTKAGALASRRETNLADVGVGGTKNSAGVRGVRGVPGLCVRGVREVSDSSTSPVAGLRQVFRVTMCNRKRLPYFCSRVLLQYNVCTAAR